MRPPLFQRSEVAFVNPPAAMQDDDPIGVSLSQ